MTLDSQSTLLFVLLTKKTTSFEVVFLFKQYSYICSMENEVSKIFGLRAVIEAINSGKTISKVYLQKGLTGHLFSELNTLIKKHNISTSYVPVEKLNRFSKNNNHQGVAAQISPIDFVDLDTLITSTLEKTTTPLFLLLDQISDVRNFGAIIRTAECTGVDGIIIQKQGLFGLAILHSYCKSKVKTY